MKNILGILSFLFLISCSNNSDKINELQNRVDSLQSMIDGSYKPGFGEFMTNIQIHHAKLWFAGTNKNWELAQFEIQEIKESLKIFRNTNRKGKRLKHCQ